MEDKAAPVRIDPVPEPEPQYVYHFVRARPRVVIKRDLLPAVAVLFSIPILGMPAGWLWARLAPPQNKIILENGKPFPVGLESYHRLDALMVFVMIGLGLGMVTGIGMWLLRQRRGPVIMLAATLGSVGAAWVAQTTGMGSAASIYAIPADLKINQVVAEAPTLETWWGLLAWPLATALAYGCCAAWNGLDDLGRRLG